MYGNPDLDRRRLLAGAAAIAGGTLVATRAEPASALAAPRVHTRSEWRARPPTTAATVLNRAPDHIVVHHTASANSTDLSLAHAYALSRSIQNFHMDGNGWSDTGQQLTISRGGHLMEGRNRSLASINAGDLVVGAQTLGHNDHTIGIENEGLYTSATPTTALWAMLVDTCAWLCDIYNLDPHAAIVGHRDYNPTACPGDRLYAMLPQLRDQVAGGMTGTLTQPPGPLTPSGLPGPRFTFDHGPAAAPNEPTR